MSATLNKLALEIETQILNDLDLQIEVSGSELSTEGENGKWIAKGTHRISTSKIGPMALCIKTLSVRISVGWYETRDDVVGVVKYDFDWDHVNGGHNGFERRVEIKI